MASQVNSPKHTKNLYQSFSNSSKKLKREHFLGHSMRPPSPWCQNQRYHQKGKLQVKVGLSSHGKKIIYLPLYCFWAEIIYNTMMIAEVFTIRMLKIHLESLSEMDFKSSKVETHLSRELILISVNSNTDCSQVILWEIVVTSKEKVMAPDSSTLAWEIPWMEEPGRLQSMGSLRVRHDWATSLSLWCTGEGNGNPLQCSCQENPRDGGAWWAAVCGVAQSQTRLKRLSSSSSSSNF